MASFASGIAIGWSSPVILRLNGKVDPGNNPLPDEIGPVEEAWIAALLPLGAIFGPFIFGYAADRVGRKKALLLCNVPIFIAFLIQAFANSVHYFYLARTLCGVGTGSVFAIVPMYMGEIADKNNKGALGCFLPVFSSAGIVFSYCVGPYLTIKWFSLICSLPSVLFLIIVFVYVPESPHYYLSKSLDVKAACSLAMFRNQSLELVQEELQDIKEYVEDSFLHKGRFKDIFKFKGLRKGFIINIGLMVIQQFSGISVLLSYMQSIFVATGSGIRSDVSSIVISTVLLLASALTPLVVDRLGRRPILLFSAIGTSISQGVIGIYFFMTKNNYDVGAVWWLPLFSLIMYMVTFNLGFGPLPWVILGEIFPPNMKSVASSIITASSSFLAFLTAMVFPYFIIHLGIAVSFWMFSICCLAGGIFVYFFVLETKGKSLNEIQLMFNNTKK